MRFSGHETFACRFAWLPKAFRATSENPTVFGDEERAMVILGVGKNMVRSIRFWGEVMGVIAPWPDKTLKPTSFGEAVFGGAGFDPYLEDIRTLWLLHWNVASRVDDPLFAWQFLFNNWPYPELIRNEALTALMRESRRLNGRHSEVTLRQHLDVFIQTYVSRRALSGPLEESLDCPFVELDLIQAVGMRRVDGSGRQEPVYSFRREAKPEITTGLFEYCLFDYWRRHHPNEDTLTYQDVAIAPSSIGQVFKLPEDDIRSRLDVYSAPESARPFAYRPSAVQGIITCNDVEHRNFLSAVYAKEDFVD